MECLQGCSERNHCTLISGGRLTGCVLIMDQVYRMLKRKPIGLAEPLKLQWRTQRSTGLATRPPTTTLATCAKSQPRRMLAYLPRLPLKQNRFNGCRTPGWRPNGAFAIGRRQSDAEARALSAGMLPQTKFVHGHDITKGQNFNCQCKVCVSAGAWNQWLGSAPERPCRGSVQQQVHAYHRTCESGGVILYCKCGEHARKVLRSLRCNASGRRVLNRTSQCSSV